MTTDPTSTSLLANSEQSTENPDSNPKIQERMKNYDIFIDNSMKIQLLSFDKTRNLPNEAIGERDIFEMQDKYYNSQAKKFTDEARTIINSTLLTASNVDSLMMDDEENLNLDVKLGLSDLEKLQILSDHENGLSINTNGNSIVRKNSDEIFYPMTVSKKINNQGKNYKYESDSLLVLVRNQGERFDRYIPHQISLKCYIPNYEKTGFLAPKIIRVYKSWSLSKLGDILREEFAKIIPTKYSIVAKIVPAMDNSTSIQILPPKNDWEDTLESLNIFNHSRIYLGVEDNPDNYSAPEITNKGQQSYQIPEIIDFSGNNKPEIILPEPQLHAGLSEQEKQDIELAMKLQAEEDSKLKNPEEQQKSPSSLKLSIDSMDMNLTLEQNLPDLDQDIQELESNQVEELLDQVSPIDSEMQKSISKSMSNSVSINPNMTTSIDLLSDLIKSAHAKSLVYVNIIGTLLAENINEKLANLTLTDQNNNNNLEKLTKSRTRTDSERNFDLPKTEEEENYFHIKSYEFYQDKADVKEDLKSKEEEDKKTLDRLRLILELDQNITLSQFKLRMEQFTNRSMRNFCVFKKYASDNDQREMNDSSTPGLEIKNDSANKLLLKNLVNKSNNVKPSFLTILPGIALREDETQIKFYYLNNLDISKPIIPQPIEIIVNSDTCAKEAREKLFSELNSNTEKFEYFKIIPEIHRKADNIILRTKSFHNAQQVVLDNDTISGKYYNQEYYFDFQTDNFDLFSPKKHRYQRSLFFLKFSPSTYAFDSKLHPVTVDPIGITKKREEFDKMEQPGNENENKNENEEEEDWETTWNNENSLEMSEYQISELESLAKKIYNIQNVKIAKAGIGSYPPLINAANVETSCAWIGKNITLINQVPLSIYNDSVTILVRDADENFGELSNLEKAELQRKEAIRIGNVKKTYESTSRYQRVERDIVIKDESVIIEKN